MYTITIGLPLILLNAEVAENQIMQNDMPEMKLNGEVSKEPQVENLCSDLNVHTICAKVINSECERTRQLTAQKACIEDLQVQNLCVKENVGLENICTSDLQAKDISANSATVNQLCAVLACTQDLWADAVVTQTACVTSQLYQCSSLSGEVFLNADTVYTLGDKVPFNQKFTDPGNNFQLLPTNFIAPVSGFYIVTAQIAQHGLMGSNIVLGTPVAALQIEVNNIKRREVLLPYLAFNNAQTSLTTSIIFLSAGDSMHIEYRIFVLDAVSGLINYPGTVVLEGSSNIASGVRSFFAVHYLSTLCSELQCPSCPLECEPHNQPCKPCEATSCQTCPPQQLCVPPCLACL